MALLWISFGPRMGPIVTSILPDLYESLLLQKAVNSEASARDLGFTMSRLVLLPDQVNELSLSAKLASNRLCPFLESSKSRISLFGDFLSCNKLLNGILVI